MPLIAGKSDKSRSENIKREIEAGKDPKQAEAIAYSVQRKAEAKGKDGMYAMDDEQAALLRALHAYADECMASKK